MVRVKKADIYTFLREKRTEVLKEKANPLQDEWLKLKDEHYQEFLKDSGVLDEDFQKAVRLVKQTFENARDKMSYGAYNVNHIISALAGIDKGFTNIFKGINYDSVIAIREAHQKYETVRDNINEEFDKINRVVKATSSPRQCIKLLNDLGFDTSSIVVATKNEVMALSVNKDLLGLPETKDGTNKWMTVYANGWLERNILQLGATFH